MARAFRRWVISGMTGRRRVPENTYMVAYNITAFSQMRCLGSTKTHTDQRALLRGCVCVINDTCLATPVLMGIPICRYQAG